MGSLCKEKRKRCARRIVGTGDKEVENEAGAGMIDVPMAKFLIYRTPKRTKVLCAIVKLGAL